MHIDLTGSAPSFAVDTRQQYLHKHLTRQPAACLSVISPPPPPFFPHPEGLPSIIVLAKWMLGLTINFSWITPSSIAFSFPICACKSG